MTSNEPTGVRVLGSLGSVDGKGVVRIEDRLKTDIEDLWSALTDPARLVRWLGTVEGDLRVGGEFRALFVASGWEGVGRIERCEAPQHLVVVTTGADEDDEHVIEASLSVDGDETLLVIEERGIVLDQVAAYGAGLQIHAEDLAAFLAGSERCDAKERWDELFPSYQSLAITDR